MSDARLRKLERRYKSGTDSDEDKVAYLAELLRAGQITERECVFAWRIFRLEVMFQGGTGALVTPSRFDPEIPYMASAVLNVTLGMDPALDGLRPSPAGTGPIAGGPAAIQHELEARAAHGELGPAAQQGALALQRWRMAPGAAHE